MNAQTEKLTFNVPLSFEAHAIAQGLRQQQTTARKAKQVYLNTLAVYAVDFYLRCMNIATDWAASDSRNLERVRSLDVADLQVKQIGRLECRPVLPDATACTMPTEVWADRIGYVAVQLNQALNQATLLGFVPAVTQLELPLDELRSLEALLKRLSGMEQAQAAPIIVNATSAAVNLSQWLQGIVETGWQTTESLLGLQTPVWKVRRQSQQQVTRGKRLALRLPEAASPITLFVGVSPTEPSEFDIWIKVFPEDDQAHLPVGLEVVVLNAAGESVMQAQSSGTAMIQLNFSGVPGEHFSVKVMLADVSLTETFVI